MIQMDVLLGNPAGNMGRAKPLIEKAAREGSRVVLLPELWTTGYAYENLRSLAELLEGKIMATVSNIASDNNVYVIGSTARIENNVYFNTCVVVGPKGVLGHSDKAHLFRPIGEDKFFTAGNSHSIYETRIGAIGTALCYDIRFPELCRSIALAGAKILFVPAEWPYPRLHHWRALLIARAIENQMFVAGCNRIGMDPMNKYFGHSMIVDPAGEVLVEGGESEALLTAELDLENVDRIRSLIPCFKDRNEAAYANRVDFKET
jgi:predicted amidohydrolase